MIILPSLLLYYLIGPYIKRKAAIFQKQLPIDRVNYHKQAFDSISAIPETRANHAQQWDMNRLMDKQLAYKASELRVSFHVHLRGTFRRLTYNLGAVAMFIYAFILFQDNQLTIGEFVAITLYFFNTMESLTGFITSITDQRILMYEAERLYSFIHQAPEVKEPEVDNTIRLDEHINGNILSGGQKQRIAIARMFIKNPRIILLDESTSALDNVSESEVIQALERLFHGRTTIAVAHRLSTIIDYDRIIVVNDGEVAEMGTYDELSNLNGLFTQLLSGAASQGGLLYE